jgi:hypothetical protein
MLGKLALPRLEANVADRRATLDRRGTQGQRPPTRIPTASVEGPGNGKWGLSNASAERNARKVNQRPPTYMSGVSFPARGGFVGQAIGPPGWTDDRK